MMQIAVLCHDENEVKFLSRGFSYENIGVKPLGVFHEETISLEHLQSDAFLVLAEDLEHDLEIVKTIRTFRHTAPIVFVCSDYNTEFEVYAKNMGCNVVVARPFSISDVAVQIKYLVYSEKNICSCKILELGPFLLDIGKRITFVWKTY